MNCTKLVKTRPGRITIHIIAAKKDHNFSRHLKGILREITLQGNATI